MRRGIAVLPPPFLGTCSYLPGKAVTPMAVEEVPAARPPAGVTLVLQPGQFESRDAFRRRGERVVLAGVSLGGLGSLFQALEYPDEVDGGHS